MADYIVVGGGSAGCVIASRLSEIEDASVVLFEQGPRDWNPYIHIPVTYYKTAKGSLLSRFKLEADPDARKAPPPDMVQGRVLGGGSSVNGMVYMRGIPRTMTTGRRTAAMAGPTRKCCRTSGSLRRTIASQVKRTAPTDRCTYRTSGRRFR